MTRPEPFLLSRNSAEFDTRDHMLKSVIHISVMAYCALLMFPCFATTGRAIEHPTDSYVHSLELLSTDASTESVKPFILPPPMDLSAISQEHWAGIVSQTKEAMAKIYGRMSPEDATLFEAEWAPYFAFPCAEVMAYFEQLHPLAVEFVILQKACTQTAAACDSAQFELVAALDGNDYEAAVSLSYNLKQLRGVLDAQAARMRQLSAAVVGLGPLPDVKGLRKQAAQRHQQALEVMTAPASQVANLEGVWSGKGLSRWTIQVLHELQPDVWLLDINQSRCVLERQPLSNVWLCVMGWPDDAPDEAKLRRLELMGGRLLVRSYTSARGDWYELGRFRTVVCQKTKPLTRRIDYDPRMDADFDDKAMDWLKYYHDRIQAQPVVVDVLRNGELPRAKERSRRREWAAARADRELDDCIELTALEQGISRYDVDREKAQSRAFERKMAEQYYHYGEAPPGFDNCDFSDGLSRMIDPKRPLKETRDYKTRLRRQNILLWGVHQRLQRALKQEYDYMTSLYGFTPEQLANDLKVLKEANAERRRLMAELAEQEQAIHTSQMQYKQEKIGQILHNEQVELDHIAEEEQKERQENALNLKRAYQRMAALRSKRNPNVKDIESLRKDITRYRKRGTLGIPALTRQRVEALRTRTREKIAEEEVFAADYAAQRKVLFARADKEAKLKVQIAETDAKRTAILSRTVRRTRDNGGFEVIPFETVLMEARYKVETKLNLPGYAKGIIKRMDTELPVTAGQMGLANLSTPDAIPADCCIELPGRLGSVRSLGQPLSETQPEPEIATVTETEEAKEARLQAEQARAVKKEKIELFEEEIRALRKSLDGIRRTRHEIAANDPDRDKKFAGLARDRLALEANICAAEDQIRFVETGVYRRTRTAADDYNRQMMAEDSRATANYWENVFRKINRMNRLIEQAPPNDQLDLRRQWNDSLESAVASGCQFDTLDLAARELGTQVAETRIREGLSADAEAARAQRNLGIAQGVKTVCDYSLTFATMYGTAGVAAPVSLIMPTCAESAVSASYQVVTGYIQGGPAEAFKQGAGAYSQVAGLFGQAMDAYQQGVLNHLDAHARNPQGVTLNEGRAGRSALAWTMGTEGVKQAAMAFVVTPNLVLLKQSLNARRGTLPRTPGARADNQASAGDGSDPPPARGASNTDGSPNRPGGIFGPDEIRFKTVAQLREDRLFRDRDIYGKHLMYKFRKASTDLENARGAGKSSRELAPFVAQAEKAYCAANSDFHAKIWMKRASRTDDAMRQNWCDVDSEYRAKLAAETRSDLENQNYSTPEMRYFSNSASTGAVGMDMDFGFVEPCRWIEVPHWKDPSKRMTVVNPDYLQWRRSIQGPMLMADGGPARYITPGEYVRVAQTTMRRAYERVYGQPSDEAFIEFTFRDHPEAFKDMAWLGRERVPHDPATRECWADFANIDPAWSAQAADVAGFKVNRLQKPGVRSGHDEFSTMPRYSTLLEQCRGLVKDFDTKLFGARADTAEFGNESGNSIAINPDAPLAKVPAAVQRHFLALRVVMNDFANGRITPSEAERQLQVLTGGKGVQEIPKEMRVMMGEYRPPNADDAI